MSGISVGGITAQSYRFAFGNFFSILGIIWLPLALEFAGLYFLAVPYIQAIGALLANLPRAGDESGLPPDFLMAMQSMSRYAMLFIVGGLFLRAVMMLGVTQEALGTRKGLPFVYFAIGKDVWRLFGAYFIFYILMQIAIFVIVFVVAIVAVIIGVLVAALTGSHLAQNPATDVYFAIGFSTFMIVVYAAIIWFLLRLGFLLTPVVVVEKRIDIARIWNLSRGNAWRMFLVCLAIFLPVFIVYMGVLLALVLHAAIPQFLPLTHGSSPAEVSAHMMAFFKALFGAWFIIVPVLIVFATLFYGMAGAAAVFSYRTLVPPPKPPAETPATQPG